MPFLLLPTWKPDLTIAQVQMSLPQRDFITLLCAHRAPCAYLYSITSHGFYNDLFKHLSLPLDCGLLKGRQPVWLTIYFYLLAQSLAHDGPVLKEPLLPAVPFPSCTQPCFHEYTLISVSSYLHLSRSMVYFTFINPGVTFTIFILIPLSVPIKLPLLPDKILTWLLDYHSLSSPFISLAAPSQPSLMTLLCLPVLQMSECPRLSFPHLHILCKSHGFKYHQYDEDFGTLHLQPTNRPKLFSPTRHSGCKL